MRLDRSALVAGLIFIALGVLYFLEELGVMDVSSSYVVPIALIGLGVGLLLGRGDRRPPLPPEERL